MVFRSSVAMVIAVFQAVAAFAADGPAEPPPPDFPSSQYIDSTGCVFLKDETGRWQARRERDSTPTCGFPPTMSAQRFSPDAAAEPLPSKRPEPTRAQQIEGALGEIVIPNLRTGELAGTREPFQKRLDAGPEPSSDAPMHELVAEIEAQGRVRSQMNGLLQPNRQLCRLLGYDDKMPPASDVQRPQPGRDPTQGFCDALPESDIARLAFTRPANLPVPPAPDPDQASVGDRNASVPAAGRATVNPPVRDGVTQTVTTYPRPGTAAPAPSKTQNPNPRSSVPMRSTTSTAGTGIPAQARFIRIGTFKTGQDVDATARVLSRLGLPVLRQLAPAPAGDETQIIMVGPFNSRESIVRAYDRVRRAGYANAVPF